ncbi:hypothetical protein V1525DRAFT_422275 [Lipomyces kononenkoae]|uniref:Uncharacterized protein n=1 Tax=Lipomyces kononenkoae TaxID=34357 RepID=A0ACC3SSZ3_LIPKO
MTVTNLTQLCESQVACRGYDWMACEDGYYGYVNSAYYANNVSCIVTSYYKSSSNKSRAVSAWIFVMLIIASVANAMQVSNGTNAVDYEGVDVFYTTLEEFHSFIVPDPFAQPGLYISNTTGDAFYATDKRAGELNQTAYSSKRILCADADIRSWYMVD